MEKNRMSRFFSPLFCVHCELDAGSRVVLPDTYSERAAYVVEGTVEFGSKRLKNGEMAVFEAGSSVHLSAASRATVMLLGGETVGERFIEWNFVSSSKERIEQAKADWRAGRMKLPDLDNSEFIPLPDEPAPPARPMS